MTLKNNKDREPSTGPKTLTDNGPSVTSSDNSTRMLLPNLHVLEYSTFKNQDFRQAPPPPFPVHGIEHSKSMPKMNDNNGIRWSVRKYILTLSKMNIVYCDSKNSGKTNSPPGAHGVSSSNADNSNVNAGMLETRQYKLIQDEVEEFLQKETPMERIERSFTKNQTTQIYRPDLEMYKTNFTLLIGILSTLGFYIGCQQGREGFLRRNRFTLYTYSKAMQSRMLNTMFREGFKSAIKINWHCLRFIVPALAIEKCMSIYRNQSNPLHFAAGFGLSGGLYKFMLGPRAMLSYTLLSGSFGLALGSILYFVAPLVGLDEETINRNSVYELIEQQRSYRRPEAPAKLEDKRTDIGDEDDVID